MDEYIKRKDAEEALYEYRMSLTMSQFADVETCIESRGIVEGAMNVIAGLSTADVVPKSEVDSLIYKLECLLCHATGGKLSKHSYDLKTMETCVNDYINENYEDGYEEAKAEVARTFRIRMNEKMGKHTHLLGKEYVQRIMREVEKEMEGDRDA